nr:hypothetical protein Iba_chr15cCG8750 [Ipomoea batatas]
MRQNPPIRKRKRTPRVEIRSNEEEVVTGRELVVANPTSDIGGDFMDVLLDDQVTREVEIQENQEINQEGRMEMNESQIGTNFVDINVEVEMEVNPREIDVENDNGNTFHVEANLDTNIGVDEANQGVEIVSQVDSGAREGGDGDGDFNIENDNFVANLDVTNEYDEANPRVVTQGEINEIFGVEAERNQEGVEIDPSNSDDDVAAVDVGQASTSIPRPVPINLEDRMQQARAISNLSKDNSNEMIIAALKEFKEAVSC